jgi:carbon storage regulator
MLVLTRKPGERLVIDNTVVVTVMQVGRGQVRLGIEAPPEVRILRDELRRRPARVTPGQADVGALQ